ncbi:DUF6993 domain-containing protein [Microbacterium sp. ZW T5_56]|uniref:DUF6993 domain-containing protein n=1 Tax=Microbacterium sp. ZW T5_56 TaxID=3378081 RepID=UPI0038549CD2
MTRLPRRTLTATALPAVIAIAAAMMLAGCTPTEPVDPAPVASDTTALEPGATTAPSEDAPAAPQEPAAPAVFVPDGNAAANLPIFTQTVQSIWASDSKDQGRAYIDALVGVGFDKAAMQVTADRTTIGDQAESIQFSVVFAGECLIGQVGPATGEPHTVVAPVLSTGACLVGGTRPIDW